MKIEFHKECTIPLNLKLLVDDRIIVEYKKTNSGIEFTVFDSKITNVKALEIVEEITEIIISERSEPQHGVTWVTDSLEIKESHLRFGFVVITWKYRIRDTW